MVSLLFQHILSIKLVTYTFGKCKSRVMTKLKKKLYSPKKWVHFGTLPQFIIHISIDLLPVRIYRTIYTYCPVIFPLASVCLWGGLCISGPMSREMPFTPGNSAP